MFINERFQKLQKLIESLPDPQDRLEYFVELAGEFSLPESQKHDCFLVPGCISRLWLVPEFREGRCYFTCDGDAVLPKGVARALLKVFSGSTPNELLAFDAHSINELGITELLGANRRNALTHVVTAVQNFARAVEQEQTVTVAA